MVEQSKLRCYGCCKFGNIKAESTSESEDNNEWKVTNKHMMALSGLGDDDSGADRYQVAMCMKHVGEDAEDAVDESVLFCMKVHDQQEPSHLLDHTNEHVGRIMTHPFNKGRVYEIPSGSVDLYSVSSIYLFRDRHLLRNIRDAKRPMKIQCIAGDAFVKEVADLSGYTKVWYYPVDIVNILSLRGYKEDSW